MKKRNLKQKYLRKRKQFLKKMRELNEVFTCEFCDCECHEDYYKDPKFLTVDHIVPFSKSETLATCYSNFAISCKGCNEEKGNKNITPVKNNNVYPDEWSLIPLAA